MNNLSALIEDVKRANLIENVIKEYIPEFQGTQGDCPWHESKGHACFSINVTGQYFKCFHCEAKGDVINFVMKFKGTDFREAFQVLAHRAGIATPEYTEEEQTNYERRQKVFDILTEAAEFFYKDHTPEVAKKLEDGWGISGSSMRFL